MRKHYLTTCLIAVLALSACADNVSESTIELTTPGTNAASASETEPELQDKAPLLTEAAPTLKTTVDKAETPSLPRRFQGLDPQEISTEELEELSALQEKQKVIALQEKQREGWGEYSKQLQDWRKQDPSTRGARPVSNITPLSPEDNERLQELNEKFQIANVRKKYENMDQNSLSKAEIQELIGLEQAELKTRFEQQKTASVGNAIPRFHIPEINPRLVELKEKIQSAKNIKRLNARIEKLSAVHNISFSDSEIGELISLEQESKKLEREFAKLMMEVEQSRFANGGEYSEADAIDAMNAIPKTAIQRMFQIEQRKEAIRAPLEAAEKADRTRRRLNKLSTESGISILSGEIAETIALNAEKDKIQSKTESEAVLKWMNEGGTIFTGQPLPNDADYARLKEIDARLKAISAPMTEAQNAAREADNPALKQQRLANETRQKWATDWQDKKQSGEIPSDTPISYPTYAQIEHDVKDYRIKLKTRAEAAGYTVSDTDLESLEALNAQKLAIRKQVYDMEVDGTSQVKNGSHRFRAAAFGKEARMYKVRLIESQQSKILAGLTSAENPNINSPVGSENGTQKFNGQGYTDIDRAFSSVQRSGAENIIQRARERGQEISQAEIDDLRAFEQALKGE